MMKIATVAAESRPHARPHGASHQGDVEDTRRSRDPEFVQGAAQGGGDESSAGRNQSADGTKCSWLSEWSWAAEQVCHVEWHDYGSATTDGRHGGEIREPGASALQGGGLERSAHFYPSYTWTICHSVILTWHCLACSAATCLCIPRSSRMPGVAPGVRGTGARLAQRRRISYCLNGSALARGSITPTPAAEDRSQPAVTSQADSGVNTVSTNPAFQPVVPARPSHNGDPRIAERALEFAVVQQAVAGQYSLERELGRGGMGVVYLAREVDLDRFVALKVLPPALASRTDIRERFVREARASAGLSHPNIVPIYRVGELNGVAFFAMAYIDGETLGDHLRTHGPMRPAAVAKLLRDVSWALAYAHAQGIVHRDVKPDNIMIERETGRVLVTDFGIAQTSANDAALTAQHEVLGTAHFMSPEQASCEPLDGRADLYSLGVVGFLALTGRLPFDANSAAAILAKQITQPAPLLMAEPGVPSRLAAVIDTVLKKNPQERYATGEAMAEALNEAQPAPATLPTLLRVWVEKRNPARIAYGVWSAFFGYVAIGQATGSFYYKLGGDGQWPAFLALLPLAPLALFHARQARRVLGAGYSIRDMRAALADLAERRREELDVEFSHPESRVVRTLRLATGAAIIADVVLFSHVLSPLHLPGELSHPRVWQGVFASLALLPLITLPISTALGVPLFGRSIKRLRLDGLREKFWGGRIGASAARLLRPSGSPVAAITPAGQPTEVALGIAAGDLYAALPRPLRSQFPELPDVVSGLESDAAAWRNRVAELDRIFHQAVNATAIGRLRGDEQFPRDAAAAEQIGRAAQELAAARTHARARLAEAVAALEAIRLGLLKLHAGGDASHQLATSLTAAQALHRDLAIAAEAQSEVDAIAGPLKRRAALTPV